MQEGLQPLGEGCWGYWTGMHMLGLVEQEGRCLLIDSGLGDAPARRVAASIAEKGWQLSGILHTHAHADHCGGSAWLRAHTAAKVYATPEQLSGLVCPEHLVMQLYGALPPRALRLRFLEAGACAVDGLFVLGEEAWTPIRVEGIALLAAHLPGHTQDSIALRPPKGPVFVGDALFPESTGEKWKLSYYEDVVSYRESLKRVQSWGLPCVVAHEGLVEDSAPLVAYNNEQLEATDQLLLNLLEERNGTAPAWTLEEITLEVARRLGAPTPLSSFYLMRAALAAHLSALAAAKRVLWELGEKGPCWRHG